MDYTDIFNHRYKAKGWDKFDREALKFDSHDMIEFAEEAHNTGYADGYEQGYSRGLKLAKDAIIKLLAE